MVLKKQNKTKKPTKQTQKNIEWVEKEKEGRD